ncbi:PliI family lysozyme inhibitor of I-type lysozyme [Paraburkholderia sp. RCC_158]|uniref:PliI family lysozyme inhibitor of I-type lysozyme n=1 Tax=Paraburkholderia sp. RCC_158 TaxID=3239220 RepID=UPI0035244662
MKRYASVALFCASLSGAPAFASGDCQFLKKVTLPERQTAVIATGDLEACSLGSYSVRIYSSENVQLGDDTTFYRFGLLHERDGTVEDAFLANLGPSAPASLIVKIRSVGSGGHVSARAYVVNKNGIHAVAAIRDQRPQTDVVAALKKQLSTRPKPRAGLSTK